MAGKITPDIVRRDILALLDRGYVKQFDPKPGMVKDEADKMVAEGILVKEGKFYGRA